METEQNHREIIIQKSNKLFDKTNIMKTSKIQLYWFTGFSLLIASIGSFLLIPTFYEPSMGLFIWFTLLLVGNLITINYSIGKIKINAWTIMLLISYCAITLGFLINTKDHTINIFLLILLIPILNVSLISGILNTNFITRYTIIGLYSVASKIAGPFLFIGDLLKFSQQNSQDSRVLQRIKIGGKLIALFLITGFPIILIAVGLLKNTNADYAQWINKIFSWSFSFDILIPRLFFILFIGGYLITEFYFLKEIKKSETDISARSI